MWRIALFKAATLSPIKSLNDSEELGVTVNGEKKYPRMLWTQTGCQEKDQQRDQDCVSPCLADAGCRRSSVIPAHITHRGHTEPGRSGHLVSLHHPAALRLPTTGTFLEAMWTCWRAGLDARKQNAHWIGTCPLRCVRPRLCPSPCPNALGF